MIVYTDILNGDELLSDSFTIKDPDNGLWEVDGRMITKNFDDGLLEGSNAGQDDSGSTVTVLDIVDQFGLSQVDKVSKEQFKKDFIVYMKEVGKALVARGELAHNIKDYDKDVTSALMAYSSQYDKSDVYTGRSGGNGIRILVAFRDNGVTPYATFWKWGLGGVTS